MFPIGSKILCDGYVIIRVFSKVKTLIFNNILCDGYVIIGNQPHHYRLPPIFNSQVGILFVPIYNQQKNKTTISCPNNKT